MGKDFRQLPVQPRSRKSLLHPNDAFRRQMLFFHTIPRKHGFSENADALNYCEASAASGAAVHNQNLKEMVAKSRFCRRC